jgi:hypothetical protein
VPAVLFYVDNLSPLCNKSDRRYPISSAIKAGSLFTTLAQSFVSISADVLALLGMGDKTHYSVLVLTDSILIRDGPWGVGKQYGPRM